MKLNWPQTMYHDSLVWIGNNKGVFSVKDSYRVVNKVRLNTEAGIIWKNIWSSCMHERLKMHLWRMLAEVIPTRDQIHNQTQSGDLFCLFFDAEVKTSLHVTT